MSEGNAQPDVRSVDLKITRKAFSGDYFTLHLDGGATEELSDEDLREWLMAHGATDKDAISKAIDHVWNLGAVTITIRNYVTPNAGVHSRVDPKV